MLVIGLTGGIGSGKSEVQKIFAELGATIIDTDVIARELVVPGEDAYSEIIDHFGKSILQSDKNLDRKKLREIAFHQPEARLWLEHNLHPRIRTVIEHRLQALSESYVIVVIPLLYDKANFPYLNRILVVDADEETQIDRSVKRDHATIALVKKIMSTQLPRQKRLALADDVIRNDGDLTSLREAVQRLHVAYLKSAHG